MAKGLSFKFATNYLFRSKKLYLPYFVASTFTVALFFIMNTIIFSDSIKQVPAGENLQAVFYIGLYTVAAFVIIFMFYLNSYLIKKRKHEFGLYGVLGLEKRHVARIILAESLILNGSSLVLGILSGMIFGNLSFLIILKILGVAQGSKFTLSATSFIVTVCVFLAIYICTTIYNLLQVNLANPIDLLKSEKKSEKKVRFVIPLTIIGVALLAWAYYVALTQTNVVTVMYMFILAVIAVIVATYLLFIAGSSFLLGRLKKNKKFYYKPNNFIAVSGMSHRMRQNAAGLASICILSTMVLVTVSATTALYFGKAEMNRANCPNDCELTLKASDGYTMQETIPAFETELAKIIEKNDKISFKESYHYSFFSANAMIKEGEFKTSEITDLAMKDFAGAASYLFSLRVMNVEDYNRINSTDYQLADNEFLAVTKNENGFLKALSGTDGTQYTAKEFISDSTMLKDRNFYMSQLFVVCKDEAAMNNIYNILFDSIGDDSYDSSLWECFIMNYKNCSKDDGINFAKDLGKLNNDFIVQINEVNDSMQNAYSLMGGLLFLGIFFASLFLVATVLIIYFKQLSEGYEDKDRFEILQKVGMDDTAVKKTINKQILIVFFLPLFTALVHTGFCAKILITLLRMFNLFNTGLILTCMGATAIVFTVVYAIVFKLTAKTYFDIVKWEK